MTSVVVLSLRMDRLHGAAACRPEDKRDLGIRAASGGWTIDEQLPAEINHRDNGGVRDATMRAGTRLLRLQGTALAPSDSNNSNNHTWGFKRFLACYEFRRKALIRFRNARLCPVNSKFLHFIDNSLKWRTTYISDTNNVKLRWQKFVKFSIWQRSKECIWNIWMHAGSRFCLRTFQ